MHLKDHFLPDSYTLLEVLSASKNSVVRRVRARGYDAPLIVKTLSLQRSQSAFYSSRYRQEFELGAELGGTFLPKALELFPVQRCWSILMEDVGGTSLNQLFSSSPQSPTQVVSIALKLVDALEWLHGHGVVHCDINPSNIVFNPTTQSLQLIDLGIAARTPLTQKMNFSLKGIEGTLAYLSPEQSGRLQRVTDTRADFYALGVTLYELLCGVLPFQSLDPLELVFQHLNTHPPSLREFQPSCPEALEKILFRLLRKSPEERYQSHEGLRHDLLLVQESLEGKVAMESFESGLADVPSRLSFSGGLYGRSEEMEGLENALQEASEGSFVSVEIGGYSGVGKTSLVRELFSGIARRRGWFLSGKFEQGQIRLPLYGVKQWFSELHELLLEESEQEIGQWRDALRARLGDSVGLLSAFSPALVSFLGGPNLSSHVMQEVSPHLLAETARSLLEVVAERRGPFVLFLDDLQWSDASSLKMLESWFVEQPPPGVLLILAYRDNEIQDGDPADYTLGQLRTHRQEKRRLQLKELTSDNIRAWVEELVPLAPADQGELLAVLQERTEGNPFFVKELLSRLERESILVPESKCWALDQERLREIPPSQNVVDFLLDGWSTFSEETRLCLRVAAMLGTVFPLSLVGKTLRWSQRKVAEVLESARQRGAVRSLDSSRSLAMLQQLEEETSYQLHYMFVHDRVRESALQQFRPEERQEFSGRVGEVLLEDRESDNLSHLLQGVDLINEAAASGGGPSYSPEELLSVNLLGAQKAFALLAFDEVVRYVEKGLAVVRGVTTVREELLALLLLGARGAALSGNFSKSDGWYEDARPLLESLDDRLSLYRIQMDHYLLEGRLAECLSVALRCLQELGFDVRDSEEYAQTRLELLNEELLARLESEGVDLLRRAPWKDDDPRLAASAHGFYALFLSAYLQGKGSLGFQGLALLAKNTMEEGKTLLTGYGLVGYGMVLTVLNKGFQLGYEIARYGAALAEEHDTPEMKAKTFFLFAADVHNWTQPVRHSFQFYQKAWEHSLQTGDWLTAGYVAMQSGSDRLTAGVSLSNLHEELSYNLQFLEKRNNLDAVLLLRAGVYQPLRLLLGLSPEGSFDDEDFCESEYLSRFADNSFYLAWLFAGRIRVHYLLGDPESYPLWIERLEVVRTFIPTHAKVPECTFFCILMLLERANEEEWDKTEALVEDLRRWFEAAPDNLRPRWEIVQAQLAAARGEIGDAVGWFERAVVSSEECRYPNLRALALELYGKFWWERGRRRVGLVLLEESRDVYLQWGALGKVRQLEQTYFSEESLNEESLRETSWETLTVARESQMAGLGTTSHSFRLDLEALFRAATILAEAKEELQFLQELVVLSMQFAGTLQAAVVFEGRLFLGEHDDTSRGGVCFEGRGDFEEASTIVPVGLFRRVLRTGVSEEVEGVGRCLPLISQGEVKGVLFLRTNAELGGLDASGVQVLEHLSSTITTLLTNLSLYQRVVETNEQLRLQQQLQQELVGLGRLFVNTNPGSLSETLQTTLERLNQILGGSASRVTLDPLLFPEMKHSVWEVGQREAGLEEPLGRGNLFRSAIGDGLIHHRSDEQSGGEQLAEVFSAFPALQAFSRVALNLQDPSQGELCIAWKRPLQPDERVLYGSFLAVFRDLLTSLLERIASELLVTKSEEARHTTVVATVAGVAHELNTPLGVALTADSVFQEELKGLVQENPELSTRRLEWASDLLRKNLRRAAELVKDFRQVILNQSHGEARTLFLHENVQQLLSTLEPMTRKLKLEVELTQEEPALEPITFVPGFLAQVLTNLLQNCGIHGYEGEGGRAWIHLSRDNEWQSIEFRDEGKGMSEEILRQCLKPFFTTKRDTTGTGLGLFVVQKLVEIDMKGRLGLESRPGVGTRWRIEFPVSLE